VKRKTARSNRNAVEQLPLCGNCFRSFAQSAKLQAQTATRFEPVSCVKTVLCYNVRIKKISIESKISIERWFMFDKVFRVTGKRYVAADGAVLYPAQDQLTGEVLSMELGAEYTKVLLPGTYFLFDTVSGNHAVYSKADLAEIARYYGLKGTMFRVGKILKVEHIEGTTHVRIEVTYLKDSNELAVVSGTLGPKGDDPSIPGKKDLVEGRIIIMALSVTNFTIVSILNIENDV
jgi:hypothetical protein